MKKVFFTYLFIFIYALSLFKSAFPVIDYIINYDYIATVLCINKEKVESNCNGKCQVAKEIEKNESSENEHTSLNKFELELYTSNLTNIEVISSNNLTQSKSKIIFNPYFYYQEYISSIFHPPKFS